MPFDLVAESAESGTNRGAVVLKGRRIKLQYPTFCGHYQA